MAEDESVQEKKEGIERRAYNLPTNLLTRLRAYQVSQGITSETEAARRLLDYALQMRDNVKNILQTLDARFADERDLRVLAGEVLTRHTLVTHVEFDEDSVMFTLRNRERGRLESSGALYFQEANDNNDYWREIHKVKGKWPTGPSALNPTWEPVGDLDEEIPF